MPGWLIFVLILLAAFAVFMFYTGYHLFMLASYNAGEARTAKQERAQRRSDVLPEMNPWKDCLEAHEADRAYAAGLAGQDLFIRSGDGLNLHGRYIPAEGEAKRIVLCMPGFRSTPEDDFGEIARWLHRDCDLLFMDQRACGRSDGTFITFGAKEKGDAARWIAGLIGSNRRNLPIYLYGMSMGASTVLLTAGNIFPESVRGIIADSSYASLGEMVRYLASRWFRIPGWLFAPFFAFWCWQKGQFSFRDTDVSNAMHTARLPILFIHGTADDYVPLSQPRSSYHACVSDKELFLVEGAGHVGAHRADPEKYEKHVNIFFERFDS